MVRVLLCFLITDVGWNTRRGSEDTAVSVSGTFETLDFVVDDLS